MKKTIVISIVAVIVFMAITQIIIYTLVTQKHNSSDDYDQNQLHYSSHDINSILEYKSKYIGDNSNVSNLYYNLPMNDIPMDFEIDSKKYGLTVYYEADFYQLDKSEGFANVAYNALASFCLIDNLTYVTLDFEDESLTLKRSDMEDKFSSPLSALLDEETWQENVIEVLDDKDFLQALFPNLDVLTDFDDSVDTNNTDDAKNSDDSDGSDTSDISESSDDTENTTDAAGLTLTKSQLRKTEELISLFENGTTIIQYDYAEDIGDGRGITCGRAGFCTGTGDALEVILAYTKLVPDNCLAKYIDELKSLGNQDKNPDTEGIYQIGDYPADWKKACKDKLFLEQQDKIFYEWYYYPAKDLANEIGAKIPLTLTVLFDTAIQHGDGEDKGSLRSLSKQTTNKLGGTPKDGIDEKKWLKTFLEIRGDLLATDEWMNTQYRTEIFFEIYNNDNFDLNKKIVIQHEYFQGEEIK